MPYAKDHKVKSRNRILQSATELFSRYSFEKVSIGEIMQKAKMTHGAFYAHFESKEALFRASFLETLKNSRAARLIKGPLSLRHLTRLVTNYLNLRELENNHQPGPETILVNEIGNHSNSVKPLFEESYNKLKKMIEIRIAALIKLKRLPLEADRELIAEKARAILVALIGAIAIARNLSQEEGRKILESAQKQILTMLGVSENELMVDGTNHVNG